MSCLQGLRVLKASRGRLSNAGAAHLAALSGLRELDLGFNPGLGDAGVQELAARLSGVWRVHLPTFDAIKHNQSNPQRHEAKNVAGLGPQRSKAWCGAAAACSCCRLFCLPIAVALFSTLKKFPFVPVGLTSLSLEGCQAVGSVACRALARGCKGLEALNVADTQVSAVS